MVVDVAHVDRGIVVNYCVAEMLASRLPCHLDAVINAVTYELSCAIHGEFHHVLTLAVKHQAESLAPWSRYDV